MNPLTIYTSNSNLLKTIPGSLVFLIGGIWMISQENQDAKHLTAGWLGIIFGGAAALILTTMLIRNLMHRRPMLHLDEKGVTFFDIHGPQNPVTWQQIQGFGEVRIHGQRFITVLLHDTDAVVDAESSLIKRKLMETSIRHSGSPYSIIPSMLNYPKNQLLSTLQAYHRKYR